MIGKEGGAEALSRRIFPEQKVIHERELESYMVNEWLFKAALNNGSGKVIVEKPYF